MKFLLPLIAALHGAGALAHEGHGLPGSTHWHATDTGGLLLAIAGLAVVVWLGRGGK